MILDYSFCQLNNDCQSSNELDFDANLTETWSKLQEMPDVFSYKLSVRNERIVEGKFGFVMQLNPERATKRRLPDKLMCLKQKFNPNSFHFNKISQREHIMEISDTSTARSETSKDLIIINSSPICFGHSLLCPNIEKCLPQVITLRSLILVMNIMFLSNNRYLRIGFNSLCAMASVNHLHYHLIILEYNLPVETIECNNLKGPVYAIHEDYPAKGFCFQLKSKHDIKTVAEDVYNLTSYLTEKNVAHNMYAMRGNSLDHSPGEVWRIFVWVRTNSEGVKELDSFNVAMCEFAGHFPVRNEEEFNKREDELSAILDEVTRETFHSVVDDVIQLFS